MSDDSFSVKRVGGARRPDALSGAAELAPQQRIESGRMAGSSAIPRDVETADVLPSELGGSVDLRLFERMNPVLVSPAISSLTHRSNVLHSVVSWLDAQSSRLAQAQGDGEGVQHPWLGSVIDTLRDEIALIEGFHRGTLTDVESAIE
ncbi:MAG: hypothetical protein RIR70_1982 [Pseudomonadota bacterium]|jgi:hypothetical protein